MPRSSGSEMPQRQSTRGPSQLKTSSSYSDPTHHRPTTDKSLKVGDRRSPRGTPSDSLNQKKLGTRIAGLESQLGQAQEELKLLKGQLASAEVAKKEVQQELKKKTRKTKNQVLVREKNHPTKCQESDKKNIDSATPCEFSDENQRETDVFEVPVDPKVEITQASEREDHGSQPAVCLSAESLLASEYEKPSFEDLALKNNEIISLKAKLEEKEKDVEVCSRENESLKSQLEEASKEISCAGVKEEEMSSRLSKLAREVEESKDIEVQLNEKLKVLEGAKEELEAEMRKLRVQTEQWRKAADAAAAVLAGGGVEMDGRRISERCGSMDKHIGGTFETPVGGYNGYVGSPGFVDDSDYGFESGKRKSSGIRMFGDLWKKKGQK